MADHQLDRFGCVANTIKTAGGHYFDLARPDPGDVDIQTIASALSKICRFGGHVPRFYSVAEHSVHCADLAPGPFAQHVLLHDAAEAYVGDVVKPLKNLLAEPFAAVETAVEMAVCLHFGLTCPPAAKVEIKRCDRIMLKAEKQHFWPDDSEQWEGFADTPDTDITIWEWSPERAETMFLDAWFNLRS